MKALSNIFPNETSLQVQNIHLTQKSLVKPLEISGNQGEATGGIFQENLKTNTAFILYLWLSNTICTYRFLPFYRFSPFVLTDWKTQGLLILLSFFCFKCYTLPSQFVIFKPLSYCFKETIGFDVKVLFASCPELRPIRWYNEPGDITKEFL